MKKSLYSAMALLGVLVAASGCGPEYEAQDFSRPKTDNIVFACTVTLPDGTVMPWPGESKVGLFCPQTESENKPVEISASSAGSETGLFRSDLVWTDKPHTFSLYYPYSEENSSHVLSGNLPSRFTQATQSPDHLSRYNIIYGNAECGYAERGDGVRVGMGAVLDTYDIAVKSSSSAYDGWSIEKVVISANENILISGDYSFDMTTGNFAFAENAENSVSITLGANVLSDEGVHAYMLVPDFAQAAPLCEIEVYIAKEGEDNMKFTGEQPLMALTEIDMDTYMSETVDDDAVNLSDPGKTGTPETANCYVVGLAGTAYKFPATVMGNGYTTPAEPGYAPEVAGTAPGIIPSVLAPQSAGILWQTSAGLISNVKLRNNHVYFNTNGELGGMLDEGNAVVAVYSGPDATGDILWSWHIWVTAADLDANLQTWAVGSAFSSYSNYLSPQLMDRNLGALSTDGFSVAGNAAYGLYYQWGRKDPFIGVDNSTATSITPAVTYDGEGKTVESFSIATEFSSAAKWTMIKKAVDRKDIAKYPMSFVYGIKFFMAEAAHDLWGCPGFRDNSNYVGHKTIYDPCPPGYRVMNAYAMTGVHATYDSKLERGAAKYADLESHNVIDATVYRTEEGLGQPIRIYCNTDNTIAKVPVAGYMDYNITAVNKLYNRTGNYGGYYWTAKAAYNYSGNGYRMDFDYNNFRTKYNAVCTYGHSVRCEKVK